MGTLISKESRRISIDNTFEITSAINIPKSIEDDSIDFMTLDMEDSIELKKEYTCTELPNEEQEYWNKRVEYLKNEHQTINGIIQSEYDNTIESTKKFNDNIPKVTQERLQKIKPCFDWRDRVVYPFNYISKCYEENPYQPLVCSQIVQEFVTHVASCIVENENY